MKKTQKTFMSSYIPKIYELHLKMCEEELEENSDDSGQNTSSVLINMLSEFKNLEYAKSNTSKRNLERIEDIINE